MNVAGEKVLVGWLVMVSIAVEAQTSCGLGLPLVGRGVAGSSNFQTLARSNQW